MRYIMVTNWDGHWDRLPDGKTRYSIGMLKGEMRGHNLLDGTETIFIKLNNKTREFQKAWIGFTSNFSRGKSNSKEVIYFRVRLDREIECPEAYRSYTEGWYLEKETNAEDNLLVPPFFSKLNSISDWEEFERFTFILLKILGIHEIYRFDPSNQRGKADGFFIFRNTVIFYDCTLDKDFEEKKSVQMDNFCGQLKKDHIRYEKKTFTIKDFKKRVWIVTKGNQRSIRDVDDIKIKEVAIRALMKLYWKRIEQNLDSEALERELLEV